jgi:hypothetical protein
VKHAKAQSNKSKEVFVLNDFSPMCMNENILIVLSAGWSAQ